MEDEWEEGMGESSSPPMGFFAATIAAGFVAGAGGGGGSRGGGGHGFQDVRKEIYARLVESGNEEAVSDPSFRDQLDAHFNRLPASYSIDMHVDKAEDVLLHRRILAECADPEKRPVFHARFLKCIQVPADYNGDPQSSRGSGSTSRENGNDGASLQSNLRGVDFRDFEPCERMMEDLSLDRRKGAEDMEAISARSSLAQFIVASIINALERL